jgi:hypothetical protein
MHHSDPTFTGTGGGITNKLDVQARYRINKPTIPQQPHNSRHEATVKTHLASNACLKVLLSEDAGEMHYVTPCCPSAEDMPALDATVAPGRVAELNDAILSTGTAPTAPGTRPSPKGPDALPRSDFLHDVDRAMVRDVVSVGVALGPVVERLGSLRASTTCVAAGASYRWYVYPHSHTIMLTHTLPALLPPSPQARLGGPRGLAGPRRSRGRR